LFEQAYLENDKHKFELAMRSLEDIRNGWYTLASQKL
jgi:hypothetical protein